MRIFSVLKFALCFSLLAVQPCLLNAQTIEKFVVPALERDLLEVADTAGSIVLAEYAGFSIDSPQKKNTIRGTRETVLAQDTQRAIRKLSNTQEFEVKLEYKNIRVLKGKNIPSRLFVHSQFHFEKPSAHTNLWKPVEGWEPIKGSKWILFLKETNPHHLNNGAYSPLIRRYSYGVRYSSQNIQKTLKRI